MIKKDIVVGGDYEQEVFRFPMKKVHITNTDKSHESIQPIGCI